ncbi:Uncharacterised protein [Vibrio cholerae]|nr:Uncharacterised protein [Vibrio cholerae]CSC06810.1 Uncharacterised protein [Vibrio cholerae]
MPIVDSSIPITALWGKLAAFDVVECSCIRGNQACFRTKFNRHVTHGHATFHGEIANRFSTKFHDIACTASGSCFTNDRQYDVFSGDAGSHFAPHFDFHRLSAALL